MTIRELESPVSLDDMEKIASAFLSAFGTAPAEDFQARVNEKPNLIVLTAGESSIDGFKIGYERFRGVFFSWLGGVKPECQRRGMARALLQHQERLCIARGYREIQTETFSDGNAMLLLNLQEGFEVFGTHLGTDNLLRVQLRKSLGTSIR